jgi:hypothetical protein
MVRPRKVLNSAFLDKRILESNAWPHMYLTDPPCACVHIDADYADDSSYGCSVLRARRCVYDPAGVTFGAIYNALHERGPVAIYRRRKYAMTDTENKFLPETTIREQLKILEGKGFQPSLTEQFSIVEFFHLTVPSEDEFEEMSRTGRVKGAERPTFGRAVGTTTALTASRPFNSVIPRTEQTYHNLAQYMREHSWAPMQ